MKESQLVRLLQRMVVAVVCVLLLSIAVTADAASPKGTPPAPAKAAPDASAPRGLPLLVDVGADKCVPCKMMAPILEELKKEYAGVLRVEFVDAWKKPEEARKYGVRGIPTQIFYDASGKELGRHMGYISKEDILGRFEQLGVALKNPAGK